MKIKSSSKFNQLQAKWYKKLEKEGFKDIEQDENKLKRWDSHYFIAQYTSSGEKKTGTSHTEFDTSRFTAKQEYYRLAGEFLHNYHFDSEVDRKIWELYAEGQTAMQIYETLKTSKKTKVYRDMVYKTIKRLSKIMVG